MNKLLVCPFCKSEKILRTGTEEVRLLDTGDGIIDEIIEMYDAYKYKCMDCEADLSDVELVERKEVKYE